MKKEVTFNELYNIRKLYKTKDSLKSESVKSKIAYSWMRSKLLKVDELKGKVFYDYDDILSEKLKNIFSNKYIESNFDLSKYKVVIYDLKCNKVFESKHDKIFFDFKNINSDMIGTNGMSLTLSSGESSIVKSTEHYLEIFDDYYTKGILIHENNDAVGLIGIIGLMDSYDQEELDRLDSVSVNNIFDIKGHQAVTNTRFGVDFYTRIIPELQETANQFASLTTSHPILLTSVDVDLSQIMARLLHNHSEKGEHPFTVLKLGNNLHNTAYDIFDQLKNLNGTLYIENIECLPLELQVNLVNSIDCKGVNFNTGNGLESTGLRILIHSKYDINQLKRSNTCKLSLLSRAETVNIRLRKFTDYNITCVQILKHYLQDSNIDLKSMDELIKAIDVNENRIMSICNSLSDVITLLSTVVYRCLKNSGNVDNILENVINSKINPHMYNLKHLERNTIEKALKATDSNIYRACDLLGISRSTLYRKIKEYELQI